MSYFKQLLEDRGIERHDGRPLWKYMLSKNEFDELRKHLNSKNLHKINPRDATLYYAEWWKQCYQGGSPSKLEIYESLNKPSIYCHDGSMLFEKAKQGARLLRINWIKGHKTFYFRTLLMQGGLPLEHITHNSGAYQSFLLAVLEEQPQSVDDFSFNPHITDLLPVTSQRPEIYENCFDIVKAILNDDEVYITLLESHETLRGITKELIKKKATLKKRTRRTKPQNHWILQLREKRNKITLNIKLANKYTQEALSELLSFEAEDPEYQLFINDELVCIFKRALSGNYKKIVFPHQRQEWNEESVLPNTYILRNGEKIYLNDFIQTYPNLSKPTLWTKINEGEWKLLKGNNNSQNEGGILFPKSWHSNEAPIELELYSQQLNWLEFEGEIELENDGDTRKFVCGVNSFDWTIISEKPGWIRKSNLLIVRTKPRISVFDENGFALAPNMYSVSYKKSRFYDKWDHEEDINNIPNGINQVKIEREGVVVYDTFYNIGNFKLKYLSQNLQDAKFKIVNFSSFSLELIESDNLTIEKDKSNYSLNFDSGYSKIPLGVKATLKIRDQRKLHFEIDSPFLGLTIINKLGDFVSKNEKIHFSRLPKLRILCNAKSDSHYSIKLVNKLKPQVKIIKSIKQSIQPMISFKDDLSRLFYLDSVMNDENEISLELKGNGKTDKYSISMFEYTINQDTDNKNIIRLIDSEAELNLFAVPVNCTSNKIELIEIERDGLDYIIPNELPSKQLIIISSNDEESQIMPRFVNLEDNYVGISKDERIEKYHQELSGSDFDTEIWKQVLVYYKICVDYSLPFSTFDQLISIGRTSLVAARAFFHLGSNQEDLDYFIQNTIPELEKDIGFCFHWVNINDWQSALTEVDNYLKEKYFPYLIRLLGSYMSEQGLKELNELISGKFNPIQKNIHHPDIRELKTRLGQRILNEVPNGIPNILNNYDVPIDSHNNIRLLLQSPIAVAESILGCEVEFPIWGGDSFRESIRRSIQYSQYLAPDFYKKVLLQVISKSYK